MLFNEGFLSLGLAKGVWLACAGDIIIGLNDTKVRNYADLFEALDQYKPGDKVNLEVFRTTSRKQVSIPITLGTRSTEVQDG